MSLKNFRPLNERGEPLWAAMQRHKGIRNPKKPNYKKRERPRLFQVCVELKDGSPRAVFPAMDEMAAGMLRDAVAAQIAAGRERDWHNPHLIQVVG